MEESVTFELDYDFIKSYVDRTPCWGPVGYITYKRTYARPLDSISDRHKQLAEEFKLENNEEWWLTVVRVVEGCYEIQRKHCATNGLRWKPDKAQASAQEMYDLIFNFKFTPPGRGLWMMGAPVVDKIGGAALNNCAFVSTKDIGDHRYFSEPFAFLMDMSMLGVGVGFDTLGAKKAYISKPHVDKEFDHDVDDTREGWVFALVMLLDSYMGLCSKPNKWLFDKIRPAGSPIKSFGGTAAGAEPLKEMLIKIEEVLEKRIDSYLTSSDIVDIMNLIGRCVVSGNVRRSAELAIGSPHDADFLSLKDYNLYPEACANWRWASNNSVASVVGMDYSDVAEKTALNGEPGYIWLDNARDYSRMGREPDYSDKLVVGVNPCSEQSLEDRELCCLAEVYPSNHDSYEEFERTLKYCYLYTKTVTLVKTHNPDTNAVMLRNRRIGVSLTGIVQAMVKHGRREFFQWCDRGYTHLRSRDTQYSNWLAVPKSIKITSVKPSGSVSLLAGVTPGIHFPHSRYYFRVIRFAANSPYLTQLREAGFNTYDLAPKEPNTVAVYFPVEEKYFDRAKDEVSMWEQLELAAQMQQYWADNQVSITVTFNASEARDIGRALELYETRLKSVSFLPMVDHRYNHAPYQKLDKVVYDFETKRIKPLNLNHGVNEKQDKFCDGDKCEMPVV